MLIFDRLGNIIKDGVEVLILKTPVCKEHRFITGVVCKITEKTVYVHVREENFVFDGEVVKAIYKRKPQQIIVIERVSDHV